MQQPRILRIARGSPARHGDVRIVGIVWVTGIAGFLGSHTARRFQSEGWVTAGIGHKASAETPGLVEVVARFGQTSALVDAPITLDSLQRLADIAGAPDVVVHAAGSGTVGQSFSDPLLDFERAAGSTAALLEFLRRSAPAARLILPSSAAVYGVQPDAPIAETTPPDPVSPYGAHKLASEIICRQAHLSFGQPSIIIRFFSIYGPGLQKQLLWDLANRLRLAPERLVLQGTGLETRDLLYIDDAVELIWQAAHWRQSHLCVNGGTGQATRVGQIAQTLISLMSPNTALQFSEETRKGDPRFLSADVSQLVSLNFRHATPFADGAARYVSWFKSKMQG